MGKPSRMFEAVLATLGWDWTPAEKLMDELTPTVAPGPALRRYLEAVAHAQRQRARDHAARSAAGNPVRPLIGGKPGLSTDSERIRSGARDIVNEAIQATVSGGLVERRYVDGERQLRRVERRRPVRCPHCATEFTAADR